MVIITGDLMPEQNFSSDAFTGLEAAIVLIAFVVVAAVFSYVVLGAGFYTTQKSQETVYKSVEQATSNIQMVGNVYGIASSVPNPRLTRSNFTIGLTPGAPTADLTKMTVVYSSDTRVSGQIFLWRCYFGCNAAYSSLPEIRYDNGCTGNGAERPDYNPDQSCVH